MRILICLTFVFIPGILLYAQITPVTNSTDQLISLKVKSVSSYYTPDSSTSNSEAMLIVKMDFNPEGKVLNKYQLYLWDVISYSYTTTYTYNEDGLLKEELKIQNILRLFKRDEDYIQSFGDKPLNEKVLFYYNELNQLIRKDIFTFSTANIPANPSPIQSISYHYEDHLLVKEESESSDDKFFNRNYTINYQYNAVENLVEKIKTYGKDLNMKRTTHYSYDTLNRIIEERIRDATVPHNNGYYKYGYNENGLLHQKFIFNEEESDFELDITYTYDEHRNVISGEREVNFDYYDNGLIKSEAWRNSTTDELITFTSTYEFY